MAGWEVREEQIAHTTSHLLAECGAIILSANCCAHCPAQASIGANVQRLWNTVFPRLQPEPSSRRDGDVLRYGTAAAFLLAAMEQAG